MVCPLNFLKGSKVTDDLRAGLPLLDQSMIEQSARIHALTAALDDMRAKLDKVGVGVVEAVDRAASTSVSHIVAQTLAAQNILSIDQRARVVFGSVALIFIMSFASFFLGYFYHAYR
jgi:hypothetical protein